MPAGAEQSQTFGDYTIHYNAINTEMLDPAVAKGYGITRSKNRALLTISVLKNQIGTSVQPVKAKVTATATNLTSQLRIIKSRELEDAGAIYYIGEIPVRNEETLEFNVEVQPEGSEETYSLKFQQQFFTE
jgi:hypothetical protein